MRYFFRTEYDGTAYGGWQRQKNAVTVQQRLEEALGTVLRAPCAVTGAGRTDAGVHARRQGVHFDAGTIEDIPKCEKSVNALLPSDISIFGMCPVPGDFNARYSAVSRIYRYFISTRKEPLAYRRVWQVYHSDIDWEAVRFHARALLGAHDFRAFRASGSDVENSVCTVRQALLEQDGSRWIFTIEADRFLYKMVRTVVGTLIAIGRGIVAPNMESLIAAGDRRRAGPTAPAWGLVLEDVLYEGGLA